MPEPGPALDLVIHYISIQQATLNSVTLTYISGCLIPPQNYSQITPLI